MVAKIIHRQMKTSTVLSHPWSIRILRNMPKELFELLKQNYFDWQLWYSSKKNPMFGASLTIRFCNSYQLVKTCY